MEKQGMLLINIKLGKDINLFACNCTLTKSRRAYQSSRNQKSATDPHRQMQSADKIQRRRR